MQRDLFEDFTAGLGAIQQCACWVCSHEVNEEITESVDRLQLQLGACQVSPAVKNAQLLGQIVGLPRSEERSRISREMHDSVAQGLAALLWQLDEFEMSVGSIPEESLGLLEGVRRAANYSLIETRHAILNLRPEHLDNYGLRYALRVEVERLVAPTNVPHSFTVKGTPITMSPAAELTVLRICQEAVGNAIRHAHPSKIDVRLEYSDAELRLRVSDDGRGFDLDGARSVGTPGIGLRNMRDRARMYDGDLEVISSRSDGTTVLLTLTTPRPE